VRAGYLVVSWFFFTVMLALMVWRIAGDASWLMFFPALVAGVIGLMFAGAARSEGKESDERSE